MLAIAPLTFAQFEALTDLEAGKRELIEGEVIELPPPKRVHGEIAKKLFFELVDRFSRERVYQEIGYLIAGSWLIPDVSVCFPDRPSSEYFEGAPMFAVEVVSPSNRADLIQRKPNLYLAHGAQVVWVMHPADLC